MQDPNTKRLYMYWPLKLLPAFEKRAGTSASSYIGRLVARDLGKLKEYERLAPGAKRKVTTKA